jgi:hypothetical protein
MAKASPHPDPRQAAQLHRAGYSSPLGPTFLTPDCGYSVLHGTLYDHLADDIWFPGDLLILKLDADFGSLVRNIRRTRNLLRRELRQTISPRRKREIDEQRQILAAAQAYFQLATEMSADVALERSVAR